MHGSPERPLPEAVKVKLGWCWRCWKYQRHGIVPREAAYPVWNQPKCEKYVTVNKAKSS